jgi:hypothetical protein
MLKAQKTNKLVNHPAYEKILYQYNEVLKKDGRVNNKKFYEEVVKKEIPSYHMQSWYYFLKRFKTDTALLPAEVVPMPVGGVKGSFGEAVVGATSATILNNKEATASAISKALNIGNARLQEMMENPQLMSAKDAIDLVFKAMKAQDSRIHAIGKVREDNREEAKLEHAFSDASYGE